VCRSACGAGHEEWFTEMCCCMQVSPGGEPPDTRDSPRECWGRVGRQPQRLRDCLVIDLYIDFAGSIDDGGIEILRDAGEHFTPVPCHQDVILDPHPAPAGQVDAWFDGDHHPGLQLHL